jgi:hypothetical protein
MDIDTAAIRRLRDALLSNSTAGASNTGAPSATGDAVLRRVEPFAETMFIVMVADDHAATSEQQALGAAVGILTDGLVGPDGVREMIDRFRDNLSTFGAESRLARIGASFGADRDDREIAFTLAAAMALADDEVAIGENRTLAWVREYFGISDQRALALIESID